jgi:hypothetical protein
MVMWLSNCVVDAVYMTWPPLIRRPLAADARRDEMAQASIHLGRRARSDRWLALHKEIVVNYFSFKFHSPDLIVIVIHIKSFINFVESWVGKGRSYDSRPKDGQAIHNNYQARTYWTICSACCLREAISIAHFARPGGTDKSLAYMHLGKPPLT